MIRAFGRVSQNLWRKIDRNAAVSHRRAFSEFYDPYPQTKKLENGQYLVQAVHDGEESTVASILESGIDPNYRWKEVI